MTSEELLEKEIQDLRLVLRINEDKLKRFNAIEFENSILKSSIDYPETMKDLLQEVHDLNIRNSHLYDENNKNYKLWDEKRIENRHLVNKVNKLLQKQDNYIKEIVELKKENKILHLKLENIFLKKNWRMT